MTAQFRLIHVLPCMAEISIMNALCHFMALTIMVLFHQDEVGGSIAAHNLNIEDMHLLVISPCCDLHLGPCAHPSELLKK